MGMTSCRDLCGDEISSYYTGENIISIRSNNDNNLTNNKPIVNMSLNPAKIFSQKFEEQLPNFGDFYDINNFDQLIPEYIKSYIKQNIFQIPKQIKLDGSIYELKPVRFKNGNIFYGYWNEEFTMEGLGKYYINEGNIFVEGIWKNGKLIYGRVFYDNEIIYEGEIKNSEHNGKGKLIHYNGDICFGQFMNGEIVGNCVYIFKDGTKYEGGIDGKNNFKGHGIITWESGIQYEGDFCGPILNDRGVLKGNNGEMYEGYFWNNYFNGTGKYTFNDGSFYEGEFESGVVCGKGKFIKKNKFEYEGNWINNSPNNFGKFSCKGYIVKGIWRNGINVEISKFEEGDENTFDKNLLNFQMDKFKLIPQSLPNLKTVDNSERNYDKYIDAF